MSNHTAQELLIVKISGSDLIVPSPTPSAGPLPAISSSPSAAVTGDSIEKPLAGPLSNPYGVCPDASRDRYPQAAAIGLGAAVLAPVLPAIIEGGSLEVLAANAAARLGSFIGGTGGFANAVLKKYASEAAPLLHSFSTRESAVEALGAQAWRATEETVRGAIVGAGLTAGAALTREAIESITHGGDDHRSR